MGIMESMKQQAKIPKYTVETKQNQSVSYHCL